MDSQEVKRWAYAYAADVLGEILREQEEWPAGYRVLGDRSTGPTAEEMLPALREIRDELALRAGEPARSRYEDWWRHGGMEGHG